MALYGKNITIDGIPCGMLTRGVANGEYLAVFEREHASLEQVEGINWARPTVKYKRACDRILPEGYGFQVQRIAYDSGCRTWTVTFRADRQYLGDVTGYAAQVEELTAAKQALTADKAALADQLAEADEAAISLYEQLAEADETAIALYGQLEAAEAAKKGEEVSA